MTYQDYREQGAQAAAAMYGVKLSSGDINAIAGNNKRLQGNNLPYKVTIPSSSERKL